MKFYFDVTINVNVCSPTLDRVERKVDTMSAFLDDFKAAVTTGLTTIGTGITNIAADVDKLLASESLSAEDKAALTAIKDQVATLASAVSAVDAKVPNDGPSDPAEPV